MDMFTINDFFVLSGMNKPVSMLVKLSRCFYNCMLF